MTRLLHTLLAMCALVFATASDSLRAQTLSPGEAEIQKCQDKIAAVHRELLGRYEDSLHELQITFQKAADLEGALAARTERQRVAKEQTLNDQTMVAEPKALRALQMQTATRIQEIVAQVVGETLPRLVEYKKALTVAGKLDEALAVRAGIARLQADFVPLVRPEPGAVVVAETLLQAYASDRARADKAFKGQKITVRGVVGGYRPDPADAKAYLVFLSGNGSAGWVQCEFPAATHRFREDKQFNATSLVISSKSNESAVLRLQKGQTVEIRGVCDGWDEVVRIGKCEFGP